MLTSEAKRKLMTGGAFGLPMVLVWITGRMIGGPGMAEAGETPELALVTLNFDEIAPDAPSDDQAAAAKRIDALVGEDFGPTPLHHRRAGEKTAPVIVEDPEDSPVPDLNIGLIMAAASGNRALIDGTVYVVGAEFGDTGWIIVDINAKNRSVSIRDPKTDRVRTGMVK